MVIKHYVNNLNWIFTNMSRVCILDNYVARRNKHIHIALSRPLMSLENTEEIFALIMYEWRKYADQSTHEIFFPHLIHSI